MLQSLMRIGLFSILLILSSCSKEIELDTKLVSSEMDTYTSDVSPDGLFMTDINWDDGTLEIINIETREVKALINQGYKDNGYCWMSAFSNSGKKIAYEWYNNQTNSHELRLFSLEDSYTKVLIPAQPEVNYWEPLDWSPDDDNILVANRDENKNWKLGIYNISQENFKDLIQLDWQAPGGMHPQAYPKAKWSPNNTFVAYDYMSTDQEKSWNIYLVDVQTGNQSTLLEDAYANRVLSWNETGDDLIFYSNRSGKPSIWKQKVENGKAKGQPEQMVDGIYGVASLGWSNGGLFLAMPVKNEKTHVATADLNNGKLIGSKPVDSIANYSNLIGDWSKEGDLLLTANFGSSPDYGEWLSIKNVNNNEVKNIKLPDNFHIKSGSLTWNGSDTVLILGDTPQTSGLHIFDLNKGDISMPFNYGRVSQLLRFAFDENQDKLYHVLRGESNSIRQVDINTGKFDTIYSGNVQPRTLAIDSKGKFLAFLSRGVTQDTTLVQLLDLESGTVSTIFKDSRNNIRPPLAWIPSSQGVVFSYLKEEKKGLMMVDFSLQEDGVSTFFDSPMAYGNIIKFSSNGKHIAFQSREGESKIVHLKY